MPLTREPLINISATKKLRELAEHLDGFDPGRLAPVLGAWLNVHPAIRDSIKWQPRFEASFYDVPETAKLRWADWEPSRQQALAAAFSSAWSRYCRKLPASDPLTPYPPVNLADTSSDTASPWVAVDEAYAWELYVRWVAHHLVVEIGQLCPWSVLEYSPPELQVLFDSTAILSRRGDGMYSVCSGNPGHPNYVKRASNLGGALVSPPQFAFGFFTHHGMPFTSRLDAIAKVLDWCSKNLRHYECDPGTPCNGYGVMEQHWQYRGIPPITRIIEGSTRSGNGQFAHWTPGCHGTTALLRHLLRALNIPVHILRVDGHSQAHFMTERLYLDHGDNPYNLAFKATGRPAVDLLIDEATYTSWFGSEQDNHDTHGDFVGYQVTVLAGPA